MPSFCCLGFFWGVIIFTLQELKKNSIHIFLQDIYGCLVILQSLAPSGMYFGIFLFFSLQFPFPLLGLGKLPRRFNGLGAVLPSLAHFLTERPKERISCSKFWLKGDVGHGDWRKWRLGMGWSQESLYTSSEKSSTASILKFENKISRFPDVFFKLYCLNHFLYEFLHRG